MCSMPLYHSDSVAISTVTMQVLGHIRECVREQKRKSMFYWPLKKEVIEGEIN